MKVKPRSTPKSRAAEEEMDRRVRAIAERCGRAPAPVHVRFDPSVIRPAKTSQETATVGAPRITNDELESILNALRKVGDASPGALCLAVGMSQPRFKTALRRLVDSGDVLGGGVTAQRRYRLNPEVHEIEAEPAPAQDPPPIADTPDLDDFAGTGAPLEVADALSGRLGSRASIKLEFPKLEFAPPLRRHESLQESYARLLIDRLANADELDVDILDRVERLILLEVADRDDAEQLIERARAIGAIR